MTANEKARQTRAIRARTAAADEELASILNIGRREDDVSPAHPNRGRKPATISGLPPYVVTTAVTGVIHYLRSTIWTRDRSRASVFGSEHDAQEAIERARQFNPRAARGAAIVGEG